MKTRSEDLRTLFHLFHFIQVTSSLINELDLNLVLLFSLVHAWAKKGTTFLNLLNILISQREYYKKIHLSLPAV